MVVKVHNRDSLRRFMFEQFPIRGHLVHLDAAWVALIQHRKYPAAIRNLLGEAAAASLLLGATIKFEGALSLELRGDGPVHLLLAQCTSGLGVRGLARHSEQVLHDERFMHETEIGALLGAGRLTVTLETEDQAQRYQGIVSLTGKRLADSLQVYFENSEQIPTRIWLHADAEGASGLLLQRLPGGLPGQLAASSELLIEDAWRRVQLLADTLTPAELATLPDTEILHLLFNEDDVRVYDESPVFFRCRCSAQRVTDMLQGLGEVETRSILAERGTVDICCDFCNRAYVFDSVDVEKLFNQATSLAKGQSVH